MLPFKTKPFSYLLDIPATDFETNLSKYVQKHRFISIKKNEAHQAILSGTKMDMAISEIPTKNSYRPVIVFAWQNENNKTRLSGYYRLPKDFYITSIAFLVWGIVITIKEQSFYPILFFLMVWAVFFLLLAFLLFRKEFDWVKVKFEDILYEVIHEPALTGRHYD